MWVDYNVFWLNVSVNDVSFVALSKSFCYSTDDNFDIFQGQTWTFLDNRAKIIALEKVGKDNEAIIALKEAFKL